MSDMDEIDELDELLGLLDEDDNNDAKEQETEKLETAKKHKYESELFVYPHCKIRVDPLTRAISFEDLQLRLRRWSYVSLLHLPLKLHNKAILSRLVLIGILSFKVIRNSKNGNKYLWIKIDDFKATISCFIFNAEIIEKFYKIQPGTVLCVAAPHILEERRQSNQASGSKASHSANISLKIERLEQILIVGKALDFGFCNKILKDGHSQCTNIVNKRMNDLCDIHKAKAYKKYASKRNDTNRSSLSKLRNRNTKKSLSGSMNGITMTNTAPIHRNRKNNVNNRCKSVKACAMPHSVRFRGKKYANGNKNLLQIKQNEKKREMDKILTGKTRMPHLGANWNRANRNRPHGDMDIVLGPKCVQKSQKRARDTIEQKGITFAVPNPNDTNHLHPHSTKRRKRSFADMNANQNHNHSNTQLQLPPRKKSKINGNNRLGNISDANSMNDIINRKSLNEGLRKEVEKENVYNELKDLEEEERLQHELEQVTSVQVTVYICKFNGCSLKDKVYEKPNSFCSAHRGNMVKAVGRKYFWKCGSCSRKMQTLNTRRVKYKCAKCGRRNFVACSAYNLTKPKISKEKLVLRNNKK